MARLGNQYNFNYQTVFSTRFDKQDGDDEVFDEIELLNITNTSKKINRV